MQCPKCYLINPDSALRCDCGYDFEGTQETLVPQDVGAKLDGFLLRIESKLRHVFLNMGLHLRSLKPEQRQWGLFIVAIITIGLAIQSPHIVYHYEDRQSGYGEMTIRTNRFTGTRVIRFKDEKHNAFMVYTIFASLGIPPLGKEADTKRDGKKWIRFEDYARFIEWRRERLRQ